MIPPCLTLSNVRYSSRLKWSNLGKGVVPSPTPWCSSYWKRSLLVAIDYVHQLYFYYPYRDVLGRTTKLHLMVRLEIWRVHSTPSLPLLPGSLQPTVIVSSRLPSVGQIENYSYFIGPCDKKISRNNFTKNVHMNVQWLQFLNFYA